MGLDHTILTILLLSRRDKFNFCNPNFFNLMWALCHIYKKNIELNFSITLTKHNIDRCISHVSNHIFIMASSKEHPKNCTDFTQVVHISS